MVPAFCSCSAISRISEAVPLPPEELPVVASTMTAAAVATYLLHTLASSARALSFHRPLPGTTLEFYPFALELTPKVGKVRQTACDQWLITLFVRFVCLLFAGDHLQVLFELVRHLKDAPSPSWSGIICCLQIFFAHVLYLSASRIPNDHVMLKDDRSTASAYLPSGLELTLFSCGAVEQPSHVVPLFSAAGLGFGHSEGDLSTLHRYSQWRYDNILRLYSLFFFFFFGCFTQSC